MKSLWKIWLNTAQYIGHFQSYLFLTVFYFTILAPFGLIMRFVKEPFATDERTDSSSWKESESISRNIDEFRRQF